MITDKNQRRSILGELEQWNVGITPEGKLASTACFVHQAVPDIVLNNNKHEILLPTVITARSDWTKNLIQQSGVSNLSDEITLKSLSLCKSLFIDHSQRVDSSPKSYYHHLNYCKIRAHVKMDKIARLTTDFEDELTRAQEHWPHHPQSSWDKLYQIWIKYGFLWPERLYLDYRQKEGNSSAPYLQSKLRKSEEQNERSQDQVQQQKENSYYIVWRANLRPMHEIFPESHHKQRDFIITVIHHCFSSLVLSERSLFRLKNVETGLYLGIQQEAAVMVDRDESFNWQFKDDLTNKALPSSSFIFIGSSKVVSLSEGEDNECNSRLSVLTKQESRDDIQGTHNSIALVQFSINDDINQPDNNHLKWTIHSAQSEASSHDHLVLNLDDAINNLHCLADGVEITLSQNSLYLRTSKADTQDTKPFTPFPSTTFMHSVNNHSPTNDISRTSSSAAAAIGNHRNNGCDSKSPMSSLSLDESRYGFSFLERAEDSNYSTLPTSRSNSFSSTYLDHTLDSQPKRTASHERVLNGLQSSPRPISVYMDKFAWQTSNEYKWMIETVSTTRKQDITAFNTQPTLIKSEDTSVETQSLKQHIKPDIDYPKRQHFAIDSFIATLDILEKEHLTMKNSPLQDERPQPQQKSQWLDGNSKLYSLANNSSCSCSSASSDNHLPKPDNQRTMKSTNTSRYNTAPESIRSARSFSSLSDQNPIFSEKKLGKQPLQQTRLTLQGSSKSFSSSSSSDRSHPWTSATPTPSDTHTSAASEQTARALPLPLSLTEAEVYKREIQQTFEARENAYATIYRNLFSRATPASNTTSQIRYYDDELDETNSQVIQPISYTATPRSRQATTATPSSSAHLTAEEYLLRQRSRERSFMKLVQPESKQDIWVKAMKQSTLSHWLRQTLFHYSRQDDGSRPNLSLTDTTASSYTREDPIRLQLYRHRTIQKKRGFYQNKPRLQS